MAPLNLLTHASLAYVMSRLIFEITKNGASFETLLIVNAQRSDSGDKLEVGAHRRKNVLFKVLSITSKWIRCP